MNKVQIALISIFLLCLFSCERGTLLNSEADIENITLPEGMKVGTPIITNEEVKIPIIAVSEDDRQTLDEQLKNLSPQFTLTEGATISPDPNEPRDFRNPQEYTVTSQDHKWKKTYRIFFYYAKFNNTKFTFDYAELDPTNSYYQFYEIDDSTDERMDVWASGNGGFAIAASKSSPADYPTVSVERNGKKVLKLETRSTGWAQFRKPIAAGNLFLGHFDISNAVMNTLQSTQFGIQTTLSKPKSLDIWCKYKSGEVFTDQNSNTVNGRIDLPSIYAVFFEPEKDAQGKPVMLNGANIQKAANIVAIARINDEQIKSIQVNDLENDEYRFISIPFEFRQSFDEEKQKAGIYYFTVVMSSSTDGDLFEGAIGSTLYVKEADLVLDK